jgi:tRNA pseudouridine55 synthase
MGLDKEYTGIIRLGATTPTYDLESTPENIQSALNYQEEELLAIRDTFLGNIEQFPPIHSAIKQDGKPIYEKARKGEEIVVKKRQVMIHSFELEKIILPELHFRIRCSSGTYIRSMAHDFGQKLGCGAFLQALRRTAIGDFHIDAAYTIAEMGQHFGSVMNARIILPKVSY